MTSTPTTQIAESHAAVESRIAQAVDILRQRGREPNIAAAARSSSHLSGVFAYGGIARSRDLNGHLHAVCRYPDRLDEMGMSAGHLWSQSGQMHWPFCSAVATSGSMASRHWGQRSLSRHLKCPVRKQRWQEAAWQNAQDLDTINNWVHKYNCIHIAWNFDENSSDMLTSLSLCLSKPHPPFSGRSDPLLRGPCTGTGRGTSFRGPCACAGGGS